MAKLNGVKTLDMQNGEITRIEYEGAVYAKVDGASDGDIGLVVEAWGSQKIGQFFEVKRVERSPHVTYVHIDGNSCSADCYEKRMNYFRKVSEVSQPFAEMLTAQIRDVGAQIDAVEQRVTALEDGKQAPAPKPKTKRPATGDIVVITGNTNGSFNEIGDIGIVGRESIHGNPTAEVFVAGRSENYNWTKYTEMRLATPAEIAEYESASAQAAKDSVFAKAGRKPNEYRKGDVVRIFKANGSEFVGEVIISGTLDGSDCFAANNFDGKLEGAYSREGDTAEIICFAEDRSDLAKGVA